MSGTQPDPASAPDDKIQKALIMKGGGVKGLALAGAIIELEKHDSFDAYVGTSAGAIAAILLAAGYDGERLEGKLMSKDFAEFLDGRPRRLKNLFSAGLWGLHSGEPIASWMREILAEEIPLEEGPVRLRHLPKRAIVYACKETSGTATFDSRGEHRDTPAHLAARYSMSIPGFFIPPIFEEERIFDGGLLHNYPVDIFLKAHPSTEFIALYLSSGKRRRPAKRWGPGILQLPRILFSIWTGRDERLTVDQYRERTVVIDVSPIGTTQFDLTTEEKKFLVWQGRAAALAFLAQQAHPGLPGAVRKASELRQEVLRGRSRRRWKGLFKTVVYVGGIVALLMACFLLWQYVVKVRTEVGLPISLPSTQPSVVNPGRVQPDEAVGRPPTVPQETGRLKITARPWAEVQWNGHEAPRLAKMADPLVISEIATGKHRLVFKHSDYEDLPVELTIAPGENTYHLEWRDKGKPKGQFQ